MDKGARFHSCDFQVHTPRDLQWKGDGAVTDEEREAYAAEFVSICRVKGLDAVAITDHHDLAFVRYIRDAAKNEVDADGNEYPPEKQLTVFPGMELTLGIPCQALLIFDAELPTDLFSLAITALAVSQTPDTDGKCAPVVRMTAITSFKQLYDALDRYEFLRGRYIVLPNISEGGTSTLLRSGHSGHYKEMPCIGGYLDGDVTQHGKGNNSIVTGRDSQYGNKALGLFQTSDNRHRDHSKLATSSTYVKWAIPTAEALRQACLAHESRISQGIPFTPPVVITSIAVSNSKFLGPVVLEFNPQYNAIIGGRGTGKSTILEYLRWALCDDIPQSSDDIEITDDQKKRSRLIEKTLISLDANIQVNFLVNDVPHIVRRHSKSKELLLKIGNSNFEQANETDIRTILPIHAYSQKQLSSVGVRLEELKRFIKTPVRKALENIDRRFAIVAADLRAQYANFQKQKQAEHDSQNLDRELHSVSEQVIARRSGLTGIEPSDQEIIAQQAEYEDADRFVAALENDLRIVKENLSSLSASVERMPRVISPTNDFPDRVALMRLHADISGVFASISSSLVDTEQQLIRSTEDTSSIGEQLSAWRTNREAFSVAYEQAKSRSSAHKAILGQLSELEIRAKELSARRTVVQSAITAAGDTESVVKDLQEQWKALHQERSSLMREQCDYLTTSSDGLIKVELGECSDVKGIEDKLRSIFTGARISGSKIEELCHKIREENMSIELWFKVLEELECLATIVASEIGSTPLPDIPIIRSIFTDTDIQRMIGKITPDNWLDLSLTVLEDQPTFLYRAREAEYIPFAEASAGQQATALLWALLNQEGPPLVIDQPEDDLDNQVVLEVVKQIWNAKSKRQLIFTSHNANLVVNGDAELVVCCDYRVVGEQSSGIIKCEGAIDMPVVRDEITKVMEGGKQAFKLRMDKYGF